MSDERDELITIQALTNSIKVDLRGCKGKEPLSNGDIDDLCIRLSSIDDDLQRLILVGR